jgi:predicted phage terminase large subunit-like protein
MIDLDKRKILAAASAEELSRRRLLDYCRRMDPRFESPRHLVLLADRLEALERREIRRLIIAMPPRHGKSRLCSQFFPSWALGRSPSQSIICASYGSELAEQNSRRTREMLTDARYPFPDALINPDSRAVNRWSTTAGGLVLAAGVGASMTGFGADLMVLDDPVRDRADAESATIRQSTWEWFTDVARTRLHAGSAMLVISTRWHEDDLVGRILSSEGASEWETLVLPAISEGDGDTLGRPEGEALWPERFPVDEMPSVARGEMSSRSFAALYQQRPVPAEGNLFKVGWFQRYRELPRPMRVIQQQSAEAAFASPWRTPGTSEEEVPLVYVTAVDCAAKTGISNDFSAIVTIATDRRNFYIIDVVRERVEFADLMRRMSEAYRTHRPRMVYVEEASAGVQIVQEFKRTTGLPIIGVPPKGSKIARAEAVSALFESGRVFIPDHAPWVDAYVDEFCKFPAGKHDDMVDATVLGLASLQEALERRRFSDNSLLSVADLGDWIVR